MSDRLILYLDPFSIGEDGYPWQWHKGDPPIKDLIRDRDGHRCLRCGHPYRKGENGNGEWSPCDERCRHGGPVRWSNGSSWESYDGPDQTIAQHVEAAWRILTVHHLNGVKHDCRWWNLVSLCQRCHLSIQTRVVMDREYNRPHSEWFKPFAAAYYASAYLGEELSREQVDERLAELLDPHLRQPALF